MRKMVLAIALIMGIGMLGAEPRQGRGMAARGVSTPEEMVDTYESLATAILAAKKTEWNMVHSILAVTYGHANATVTVIRGKIRAGEKCSEEIEKLADLVAQLGNEGDAGVAAIRKRLLEGGHHHNAKGEQQGIYDEGFVIVTRDSKKALLDVAGAIGKMTAAPSLESIDEQWKKVAAHYGKLVQDNRS